MDYSATVSEGLSNLVFFALVEKCENLRIIVSASTVIAYELTVEAPGPEAANSTHVAPLSTL